MIQTLKNDLIVAMKEKNQIKANTIRRINAIISDKQHLSNNINLTNEDIQQIIQKEVKMRYDSIKTFEQANRQDLIDQANQELEVLKKYLPQQLSEEEVIEVIKSALSTIQNPTKKDLGKIMKIIMPKLKGKVDGKLVNKLVLQYI